MYHISATPPLPAYYNDTCQPGHAIVFLCCIGEALGVMMTLDAMPKLEKARYLLK
jgi:hypothetical protein